MTPRRDMGWDATNTLKPGTDVREVGRFLQLLGYERAYRTDTRGKRQVVYWHYNEKDYLSHQSITALILSTAPTVSVHTRTLIFRSTYDARFHNHTVRQLKARFGGRFETDAGKGRYFRIEGEDRQGADSGCFIATWRFDNRLFLAQKYLMYRSFAHDNPGLGTMSSEVLSNHLVVPYIVASLETWWRDTYEALLKYSARRDDVLRGIKLDALELVGDDSATICLERAVARRQPFQNLQKAIQSFKSLDPKLNLHAALVRPYRRRKSTLYDRLARFLERRHVTIHGAEIDDQYMTKALDRDLSDTKAAVLRMYEEIINLYGWSMDHGFR